MIKFCVDVNAEVIIRGRNVVTKLYVC